MVYEMMQIPEGCPGEYAYMDGAKGLQVWSFISDGTLGLDLKAKANTTSSNKYWTDPTRYREEKPKELRVGSAVYYQTGGRKRKNVSWIMK